MCEVLHAGTQVASTLADIAAGSVAIRKAGNDLVLGGGENLHSDTSLMQEIVDCHHHCERDGDDLREVAVDCLPARPRQIQNFELRHGLRQIRFEVSRNDPLSQYTTAFCYRSGEMGGS